MRPKISYFKESLRVSGAAFRVFEHLLGTDIYKLSFLKHA